MGTASSSASVADRRRSMCARAPCQRLLTSRPDSLYGCVPLDVSESQVDEAEAVLSVGQAIHRTGLQAKKGEHRGSAWLDRRSPK